MRNALMISIVTLSVACIGGGIVGSSTVTGAYALSTINGSPLPYTMSGSGTTKTEIVGDTIFLYEGFTFAETKSSRTTLNGAATTASHTETGSYGLLGTSISLRGNDGGPLRVATIEANTMTLVDAGLTSVFKKK